MQGGVFWGCRFIVVVFQFNLMLSALQPHLQRFYLSIMPRISEARNMESKEDSVASAIGIGASLTKSMSLGIKSTVVQTFALVIFMSSRQNICKRAPLMDISR